MKSMTRCAVISTALLLMAAGMLVPQKLQAIDNKGLVKTTGGITTITREDIEKLPSGRTLPEILSLAPGVSYMNNQVSTLGLAPYDNTILIDGVPVSDPMMRQQFMGLPPDAIEKIEVHHGGMGAQYGGTLGGVINVTTRRGSNSWTKEGSAYFNPGAFSADPKDGMATGNEHINSMMNTNISLGGPIIKDKLWFFGSFNQHNWKPAKAFDTAPKTSNSRMQPWFTVNGDLGQNRGFNFTYHGDWYKQDTETYYGGDYGYNSSYNRFSGQYYQSLPGGWTGRFSTGLGLYGNKWSDSYSPTESSHYDDSEYSKKKKASHFYTYADFLSDMYEFCCGPNQFSGGFGYDDYGYNKKMTTQSRSYYTETDPTGDIMQFSENYYHFQQDANFKRISFYIQDTVTFGKMTANVGLRYERSTYTWNAYDDGNQKSDKTTVAQWSLLSPRISFTYDITGDGKNVVKASYARYGQPMSFDNFTESDPLAGWGYTRNWATQNGETLYDNKQTWVHQPYSNLYDGDYSSPYLDELTLMFEKALTDDLAISVTGFYKKQGNMLQTADANRLDMDALLDDGQLKWVNYEDVAVNGLDLYNDLDPSRANDYVLVNVPGTGRSYKGVMINVQKKFSDGWMSNLTFTWSDYQGTVSPYDYMENYGQSRYYQNPNAAVNADGAFQYQNPWEVVINNVYQAPYGIQVGSRLMISGGSPYTKLYQSTAAPFYNYSLGGGTIYSTPRGDDRLPTFWMLNLGLEKTFKVSDQTTATLFVDGYNVTNNSTTLQVNPLIGSSTEDEIQRILNPGLFQFGVRVSF